DSWTTTSPTNAPDGRYYHTAVWTGSEMIVWGGYNFSYLNTGGRYNPGTDSWTATSPTTAPAGRADDTAVWTGSEMIVWSGYNGSIFLNTGGRYCAQPPNQSPIAEAGGPYTGTAGEAIQFDGSGSFDPDGVIVDYAWAFGDGGTASGVQP